MNFTSITLIDEVLSQGHYINLWAWFFVVYFGSSIARVAGKYLAIREVDKFINPIASAFYVGAMCGVSYSINHPKIQDKCMMIAIEDRLDLALKGKICTY